MQIMYMDMPSKIKAVQCKVNGTEYVVINEKLKNHKDEIEKELMKH